MTEPSKALCALRYWLHGKEYFQGLEALEFAAPYHSGLRKDGVTPEFHHQVEIAMFLRTLEKLLLYPQEVIAVGLLHDVVEDYDVSTSTIQLKFGMPIAQAVNLLSKKADGFKKTEKDYYHYISENPIASIVKGADRINNIQTMTGVFTKEKQLSYIAESKDLVLPMLKVARRKFPQQEAAYENIKHLLTSQMSLIESLI